jgi:hypothetical protein
MPKVTFDMDALVEAVISDCNKSLQSNTEFNEEGYDDSHSCHCKQNLLHIIKFITDGENVDVKRHNAHDYAKIITRNNDKANGNHECGHIWHDSQIRSVMNAS